MKKNTTANLDFEYRRRLWDLQHGNWIKINTS